MSKVKTGVGVVMAVLLLMAYMVAQGGKDKLDERAVMVTVKWTPEKSSDGVIITVTVAGTHYVGGATFINSPFHETYDAKPGDKILVSAESVNKVGYCLIAVEVLIPTQPAVSGSNWGDASKRVIVPAAVI